MDGTFKICPPMFYQIYTIHIEMFGRSFPIVYIMMKNRKLCSYIKAFEFINCNKNIIPEFIIVDFEIAAVLAAERTFLKSKIKTCIFYFCQNIWRQVQSLNLTTQYKQNMEIRKVIRMLLNLVFVPENNVRILFLKIKQYLQEKNLESSLDSFVKYFEETYIGIFESDVETKKALFSIRTWSTYTKILKNASRTTNSVESWHRNIKKDRKFHTNMSRLLDSIIK
jgi:hypothetical protein